METSSKGLDFKALVSKDLGIDTPAMFPVHENFIRYGEAI